MHFNTVKSSVWSLDQLNHGGRGLGWHEGPFSRDPLRIFSTRGPWGKIWHGQGCPFFDVVHPASSLPITASPTLQRALNDGFVVTCDMPEPYQFLSLDGCQKRSMWTHTEVVLDTHQVIDWSRVPIPQWGAADAEIKVPSGENTELKRSSFQAWSRSVYSHTCYAYCQGVLPCLFLPF